MALPSTTLDSKMFYKKLHLHLYILPKDLTVKLVNQLVVNIGSDAPSTIPKLLHLVRLPRTHSKAAQRMATPKGCSHFIEILSLSCWTKNLASGVSKPSTETQSVVKNARRL